MESQTKETTSVSGKCGAPAGNRNRLRHGLRASRTPPGCRDIEHDSRRLRINLEDAVLESSGSVSIVSAALINSSIRHEKRARLIERWLSQNGDIKLMDRVQLLRELSGATDSRDRCIERLKIGSEPDLTRILYGPREPQRLAADDDQAGNLQDK